MQFCAPCGGLQPDAKLLNDCYPPSKALLNSGPDYKPLSQDVSKLTYRCTNQSSKLVKIGDELEQRVMREASRSSAGYPKSRASLLISLAILRALITECRRDLGHFARSIVRIVNTSLDVKVYQKGGADLEVVGRAASCFTAFTTYANGNAVGIDDSVTNLYITCLKKFAALAVDTGTAEKPDAETRNRTRLIALAALNGASSSDAIFSSTTEFHVQASHIVPALLTNIFEGSMAHLQLEAAKIEIDAAPSPFFSEFSARRPLNDRRAPSLHAHISGEKGPSSQDVLSAALRSLHALFDQCQVNQLSHVLDTVFLFLDRHGWQDAERCSWLVERMTAFSTLQYRFVVPTRLVELLAGLPDSEAAVKQHTILTTITVVLNSPISLVGLGVADILGHLITLIIRRVRFGGGAQDGLLPPLVQSVASLGTHIYYSDQVNDIVEEIAIRMSEVPHSDSLRPEILRVLVHCITSVMTTATMIVTPPTLKDDKADQVSEAHQVGAVDINGVDKGKAPKLDQTGGSVIKKPHRRNPISPEVWQETLPLLCESTFALRIAYARALLLYIQEELPREIKPKPSSSRLNRFCNAVHAAIYTLAMSSCLGIGTGESSPTPGNGSPVVVHGDMKKPSVLLANGESAQAKHEAETSESKGEKGVASNLTPKDSPPGSTTGSTPPKKPIRTFRRVSLPLNRLNSTAALTSFDNVATPLDFGAIVAILEALYSAVPKAALVTGVPMLLALDKDAGMELVRRPGDGRQGARVLERKRAIKEVVAIAWRRLGTQWGVTNVVDLAIKASNSLSGPSEIPNLPPAPVGGILPAAEEPAAFARNITEEGESSSAMRPTFDPDVVVSAFASSSTIQTSTGQDASILMKRWMPKWTVESAIKNSVEQYSAAQVPPSGDTHFDIAKALMSMSNPSYHSFAARPHTRPVDVTDLREALGRGVGSASNSSPPSITSTGGAPTLPEDITRKRATNTDVKDILKEIFKDKKRGSGTQRRNQARANLGPPPAMSAV